jgi:hypothetical protein
LRKIGEWRVEERVWLEGNQTDVAMTTEQINSLMQREREQSGYPAMPDDDGPCNCPACRAMHEGLPPELARMMEEIGPDALRQALEEIIGGGPPRRKGRRSRRMFDEDVPF